MIHTEYLLQGLFGHREGETLKDDIRVITTNVLNACKRQNVERLVFNLEDSAIKDRNLGKYRFDEED